MEAEAASMGHEGVSLSKLAARFLSLKVFSFLDFDFGNEYFEVVSGQLASYREERAGLFNIRGLHTYTVSLLCSKTDIRELIKDVTVLSLPIFFLLFTVIAITALFWFFCFFFFYCHPPAAVFQAFEFQSPKFNALFVQ